MKSTELRLGNTVQDRFGNKVRLTLLDLTRIVEYELSPSGDCPPYSPVRLNRYDLEDMGFTKVSFSYYDRPYIYLHKNLDKKFDVYRGNGDYLSTVEWVHELENLFFTIYKTEIK